MRQVQEIIYVTPDKREEFLKKHLNPSDEVLQILWKHGIRNQYYYELNDLILTSFEYSGKDFYRDMAAVTSYDETKDYFIQKRRRDVPADEITTSSWWAPLKILGKILTESPYSGKQDEYTMEERYRSMMNGFTFDSDDVSESISYDDDDWSETIRV